jgi:uncharacterized protein (DUF58 family)
VHLGQRAYVLIVAAAVFGVAAIWSSDPALADLWRWPLIGLLAGLAYEAWQARRTALSVQLQTARRAFLGRLQPAAFVFRSNAPRKLAIEYVPALPPLFEPLPAVRKIIVPAQGVGRDVFNLSPVRLGSRPLPDISVRVGGALQLAWWSQHLAVTGQIRVAPDTLREVRGAPRGSPGGGRARRMKGAGQEFHQLRGYLRGDPLSRIDWKATARVGEPMTRESSEDRHLDILIALDAGAASRVSAGRLDRYALYANVTARFAEAVTPTDDRVGLVVFAERPLAICPPGRGRPAVARVRQILESLSVQPAPSDPLAAAIRIRRLLTQRSLILLLTDLIDTSTAEPLMRALRLLSPPHLVVVASVRSQEVPSLAHREAREPDDPWIALAAQEIQAQMRSRLTQLRRLGAPVIAVPEERLEEAVLSEYAALRRLHRL